MAIRHSTLADNSFTPQGKAAWDAGHTGDASDIDFVQSGTGAVTRSVRSKVREVEISTEDFNNGESDYALVIKKAFDYAETLLPTTSTQPDGFGGYSYGGLRVKVPSGRYSCSTAIAIPPHINFEGDGAGSTVISFTFNGSCVTVKSGGSYPYNHKHSRIALMTLRGDRSKGSQIVCDLTRFSWCEMHAVDVDSSGTDGIKLTECLASTFTKVRSNGNVGAGWRLSATAGPLPCNANTFTQCEGFENDAEGLVLDGAFGNRWIGGTFEGNFASSTYSSISNSATATMRQVRITGISRGNKLNGTWFEGECNALVYVDLTASNTTQFNKLVDCTFIPSATTDRAVVVNLGHIRIVDGEWQAASFKTINSSNVPFRINTAVASRIYLDAILQTQSGGDANLMVEDVDGNMANLAGLALQTVMNGATMLTYGRYEHYIEHGQVGQDWYKSASVSSTDWEEQPFLRVDAGNRGISAGDGASAPDTIWRRSAANTWKTDDRVTGANFITFGALDTTPTVANGNFFVANNGSATTITNFDDNSAVQEITVFFSNGNTTIQHNTTIKLVAGADFVGSSNDLLTLVGDGSVWYEKSRSVNGA